MAQYEGSVLNDYVVHDAKSYQQIANYYQQLVRQEQLSIVELEKPDGAIVQFGGQTAIKLTKTLNDLGVPILGTDADSVDAAEDRERFDEILESCGIARPKGETVFTIDEE